jgi:hypothetical protein
MHKTSSNILERMGPPPAKYLKGHYFNFECFLLYNTYIHLQWLEIFHCGTRIQMVKSLELLKGLLGATQYMLFPQVDQ